MRRVPAPAHSQLDRGEGPTEVPLDVGLQRRPDLLGQAQAAQVAPEGDAEALGLQVVTGVDRPVREEKDRMGPRPLVLRVHVAPDLQLQRSAGRVGRKLRVVDPVHAAPSSTP